MQRARSFVMTPDSIVSIQACSSFSAKLLKATEKVRSNNNHKIKQTSIVVKLASVSKTSSPSKD
jgi:hypothetical protein